MTPNKLPPLPEYLEWLIDECRENAQMAGLATPEQRGWDHMADKLEALRQSQSLPAGAVADGPVFYVQRTYDCNAGEDRGEIIPTLPANLIGKRVRLVPVDAAIHVEYNWEEDCKSAESALEAMTDAFNNVCDELKALQADAREKGEAVEKLEREVRIGRESARRAQAMYARLESLAKRWEKVAEVHGVRQFTGNDHLLFANELRTALQPSRRRHRRRTMGDRSILASNLRQMASWCKSGEDDDGSGTFIPAYPSGDVYDILMQAARELAATHPQPVTPEDFAAHTHLMEAGPVKISGDAEAVSQAAHLLLISGNGYRPLCKTCNGHGLIGGRGGQTPESYEEWAEPCPDCKPVTPAGGEVVYAVNTGELDESGKRELYTLTDKPIPMADNQKLYTNQLPDGMVMVQIRDAKALARFAISNAGDGARGDTKLAGMRVAGLVDAALNQRGGV